MSHVAMGDAENYFRSMTLGYPRPGVTRPEMFLSQDTLTSLHSVHTTQPNTRKQSCRLSAWATCLRKC